MRCCSAASGLISAAPNTGARCQPTNEDHVLPLWPPGLCVSRGSRDPPQQERSAFPVAAIPFAASNGRYSTHLLIAGLRHTPANPVNEPSTAASASRHESGTLAQPPQAPAIWLLFSPWDGAQTASGGRIGLGPRKIRREVLTSRRKVTECHECFKSEALASSAQDQTLSINPSQEMRNSF